MPFKLAAPIWLLLVLVIFPAVAAWHRYLRSPGVPRLTRAVTPLRAAALLCLVLALAGTQWVAQRKGVDLFVAVDVSQSISPLNAALSVELIGDLAKLAGRNDRIGLVAFGGEAYVDQPLGADLRHIRGIESSPSKSDTNVESVLNIIQALADPERNTRLLLLSDGLATQGDAESLVSRFNKLSIPIDAVHLGSAPNDEVSIEQVTAPTRVAQEQPFRVRVIAAASSAGPARIRVFRNDELISDQNIGLTAGRNVFDFSGLQADPGVYTFTARIEAAQDTLLQNNASYAAVVVEGPNRMLLVTDSTKASTALLTALRQQGVLVDVSNAANLPANATVLAEYASVLIHDVPAPRFSQTQLEQISSYVRNLGGGLLVVGGHNSYGLGGYYKTPLEDVLPVTMDAPQTLVMPSLALVLVIDHSGSMGEKQGQGTKLELAKEASLGVVDVITEQDLFGVLAFDDGQQWTVPLQLAANSAAFADQISKLGPGGGTDLGPAMAEAFRVLSQTDAMVKHMVILTDGHSTEYDFARISGMIRSAAITISTVAVGEGADTDLLEEIAKNGAGRFHYTRDASAIPRIFANEVFLVSRPLAVEETVQPSINVPEAFLTGPLLTGFPPLDGYVLTTPKNSSAVHLQTINGDTLLASWRHGLGRAVAFTSGTTDTWAKHWLSWDGFAPFWAQLARWIMRPQAQSALQPVFSINAGKGSLIVDAVAQNGEFVNFLDLEAEIVSPERARQTIKLEQTSPGRFQADFSANSEGTWLATVSAHNHPEYQDPALAVAVLPYSAEFSLARLDTGLLSRLTKQTGGTLFPANQPPNEADMQRLFVHPTPVTVDIPLWSTLLLITFILFFVDIALRYLPPPILYRIEQALARVPLLGRLVAAQDVPGLPGVPLVTPAEAENEKSRKEEEKQKERSRLVDLIQTRTNQTGKDEPKAAQASLTTTHSAARYLAERRRSPKDATKPPSGGPDDKN